MNTSKAARLIYKLKKFKTDRSGNFGILFALTILPVIMAIGMAIDYSIVANVQAKLNSAADAASLAGVTKAKNVILNAAANENSERLNSRAISAGQAATLATFRAQTALIPNLKSRAGTPNIIITGQDIGSTFTYIADAQLSFGRFFNMDSFQLKNSVSVQTQTGGFLDIHIVIDNSGSMGVGATPDDIAKMEASFGCAFGCHIYTSYFDRDGSDNMINTGKTNYEKANSISGVKMKIDIVRENVARFITNAKLASNGTNQFRFTIYTFSNSLVTVYAPSTADTNYEDLLTAIATIHPETVHGGTNLQYSIGNQLTALVPVSKSGNDSASRRTHVIMFTDGVEDGIMEIKRANLSDSLYNMSDPNLTAWGSEGSQHLQHGVLTDGAVDSNGYADLSKDSSGNYIHIAPDYPSPAKYNTVLQAINPDICQGLKNKGVNISILLSEYDISSFTKSLGEGNRDMFNYINDKIMPLAIQNTTIGACASSDSFYPAHLTTDIANATDKIFSSIVSKTLRITH